MTMQIPPAMRAELDRELATAIDGLLGRAAERDGMDVIEANVDLTNEMLAELSHDQLAATTAMLAIQLHRRAAR